MPFGYVTTVGILAVCTSCALWPRVPAQSRRRSVSFWLGFLVNELPFLATLVLVASTALAAAQGDLVTPVGLVGLVCAVATIAGLAIVAVRALPTRDVMDRAVPGAGRGASRRWARIVLWPFPFPSPSVQRSRNIAYADGGRYHRLDVYRRRRGAADGPTFVHFHGGAFRSGRKSREARPLLNRLARRGWVCVSANYRLTPHATFPDQLVDAKRVVAWVREEGRRYGADGDVVIVSGSSAGGHLASMLALTIDVPAFQPGFESADTTVAAAVPLYGYLGPIDTRGPLSSPHDHVHEGAPPFLVVHGDHDSLVPAVDARAFVDRLRSASSATVAYAELPGAQHDFDFFHSLRFEAVIDGIERFARSVVDHST
jgi:acetyl esterase/lipase